MTTAEARAAKIGRYGAAAAAFRAVVARVPEAVLDWRPGPGKWTVREVIGHMADSETMAASRLRLLLSQDAPTIVGYDENRLAVVGNYSVMPIAPALAAVEGVQRWTHALLLTLPDAAFSRTGTHTESGPYSVDKWLDLYSNHTYDHVAQVERNLAAHAAAGGR